MNTDTVEPTPNRNIDKTPPGSEKKTSEQKPGFADQDLPEYAPPEHQPEPRTIDPVMNSNQTSLPNKDSINNSPA